MNQTVAIDRNALLLTAANRDLTFDSARAFLETAALTLSISQAAKTPWGQSAALTIAACAIKMFRGGVYVVGDTDTPAIVGHRAQTTLRQLLAEIGCSMLEPPAVAYNIHVGGQPPVSNEHQLYCWADGWLAVVSPRTPPQQLLEGNELSGALSGALAVSEAFRAWILRDAKAGKRTQRLSPLTPRNPTPDGIRLDRLPSHIWLLGLGNLGQATLWALALLPYKETASVHILLQDSDISGAENLSIQILTDHDWIGQKKARAAAKWAEARGFPTTITERRFTDTTRRGPLEPALLLVGVDDLPTRRLAAHLKADFHLVIDAGLGATAPEVFDIRIHAFPGARKPEAAWPDSDSSSEPKLTPALSSLVKERRLDMCGAMTIAGTPVGIPTTAVAAATIQLAQACRALATGTYCDYVDLSLRDTSQLTAYDAILEQPESIPSVPSLQRR